MSKGEWSFYQDTLDCVHCGLCLSACPTYQLTGLESESPRGRLYLMRALAEGRNENPTAIQGPLDRCLGCRACETACPSGVPYGRILEDTRADLVQQGVPGTFRVRLARTLLRHVVARPRVLRTSVRAMALLERLGLRRLAAWLGLLPRDAQELLPPIPPAGLRRSLAGVHRSDRSPSRGRVHLLTGCIMDQMFGAVHRATIRVLNASGWDVVVPDAATCCGALHAHAGDRATAARLARDNVAAFADAEVVLHNSAGCGAMMREYEHHIGAEGREIASRSQDVCEFLAIEGLRHRPAARRARVGYDAPCHLHHGQGVQRAPLELLAQVPGLELVAIPGAEDCCGSAGIYNLLQPEVAEALGAAKAEAIEGCGVDLLATGNPGCALQIRRHLRSRNSSIDVVHPIELLGP